MDAHPAAYITVVVVDDHALIRQGIRHVLSGHPDIQIVGEGASGIDVFPLVDRHRPNVLLLDVGLPQSPQSQARFAVVPTLHRLAEAQPQTRVIIVSQYCLESLVYAALEAGVRGYILKDDLMTERLHEAVYAVHRGRFFFSQALEERALALSSQEAPQLSAKQREVLSALAANPEADRTTVAASLGISQHTLNHHLRMIYKTLGVSNLLGAVLAALEHNLLPLPSLLRPGSSEAQQASGPPLPAKKALESRRFRHRKR
ncbi:MAG: DNA-binding response regulator [Caldilineae bacterium]|nr:MAG: DNA-binding response regulator [Caldilineae bacterium]